MVVMEHPIKSLKAYKVLRVGDLAFEGHTIKNSSMEDLY